ncbi:M15 family metallopeptidase [Nocardioides conyzicola]|uniref:Peptidase M15C domain-containing protein n=1 Tax=Nocardioides conyzicola TaxID=1651781 RepID=A0ABP8WXJ6_9ACTN
MSLGSRVGVVVCAIALAVGLMPAAGAADSTILTLSAPAAYADTATTLGLVLADDAGSPLAGAQVVLERRTGGAWQPVGTLTTDAEGRASAALTVSRVPDDNAVRATYAGDAEHPPITQEGSLPIRLRAAKASLSGPAKVVDEKSVVLRVRWLTTAGQPVSGDVRLYRKLPGKPWRAYAVVPTDADGRGSLRVTPRTDTHWQVRAPRLSWVQADRSTVLGIDNRPPGEPVKLPKGAPAPRIKLPAQPHAAGAGANVRIGAISNAVWRQMVGVSWHSGCPVGRSGLRIVRVNYWDYHGYRRRGELVASAAAAGAMGAALADMYRHQLPIRAMYRVDRFGWSGRSRGGDDYASMAAGNTSAFNCRDVTGRPGNRSPHSWGGSLDVNTWENPYRSARGTVPNTWWQPRSHKRVAWRSSSHAVVRIMARHGLRWTYGNGDTQHFDYVGGGGKRMVSGPPACTQYCD